MARPIHRHATSKMYRSQPNQSFIARLFSNPWPYAISPLQAYLLGVFLCISTFVLYIFVSHSIYKMHRKKMRARKGKRRGTRVISSGRATKYQPIEREVAGCSSIEDYSVRSQQNAAEMTGAAAAKQVPELLPEEIVREDKNDSSATDMNSSSYELYRHMNSFPLETDLSEGGRLFKSSTALLYDQENNHTSTPKVLSQQTDQGTSNDAKDKSSSANSPPEKNVNESIIVASAATSSSINGPNENPVMIASAASSVNSSNEKIANDHHFTDVTTNQVTDESIVNGSSDQNIEPSDTDVLSSDAAIFEHCEFEDEVFESATKSTAQVSSVIKSCSDHIMNSDKDTEPDEASDVIAVETSCLGDDVSIGTFAPDDAPASSRKKQGIISFEARSSDGQTAQCDSHGIIEELSSSDAANDTDGDMSSISHLVVLLSMGVADCTQAVNQNATLKLLDDLHLPYHIVDGMDPFQHEKRDDFFRISGMRGNYPQIFVYEEGQHRYLGGYDWLKESIADISGTSQGNALLIAVGQTKESKKPGASVNCLLKGFVTVLVSNGVADYHQKANQKAALQLLTDLKIPYKIVDGMDPAQADKRNELFKTSGMRGNYPQIFMDGQGDGQIRYLGGYDWLEGQSLTDLAAFFG